MYACAVLVYALGVDEMFVSNGRSVSVWSAFL